MIDALDGYRDVVILAEKDADETDIRRVQRMGSIQYVYGDATDREYLVKAGIGRCHHVIIVRDVSKPERSDHDARALMIILSVRSLETENGREFGEIPIATELNHTDSFEHLKFPALRNVHVVGGSSIAAQMLIQTVFNPDIVSIYNSFLYRPGSEIYTVLLDNGIESTFADFADAVFEKGSIALGFIRDGLDVINPNRDSKLQAGDRAILISDDQESAVKCVRSALTSLRK
jgi:Trk K+ transport system NAD-binding subunit